MSANIGAWPDIAEGPRSEMFRSSKIARRAMMASLVPTLMIAATGRMRAGENPVLRIGGTGMALAAMQQIGAAFVAAEPGVGFRVLPSLGTGGGLSAVAAGAIDLALAARELSDAERAKNLQSMAYARTPIAFVTQAGSPARAITLRQVCAIFAGETVAWPDGSPIRLVRRETSDADWSLLRNISPEMADAVRIALQRPGLMTVATDQENADALERLEGSFGAMSLGQMLAEARRVVPLMLDGTSPTVNALAAGDYPLSRTLRLVWREPAAPPAARFLAFIRSRYTGDLLTRLGHLPLAGHDA